MAAFASFGGFLFLTTLYLQDARGLSAVEAGLAMVPIALMIMLVSPISGRVVGRRGPRGPLVIAGLCFSLACGMLVDVSPETSFGWLVAAYTVFGIGLGAVNAPITNAAVSGMPDAQAGVAAAVATTSRQFGQALGVAVVGAIVASGAGEHAAWWTLTGLGALVLVVGVLATGGRARDSARRAAVRLNPGTAPT